MARVVVTGATGRVGGLVVAGLTDHELTPVDRRRGPGVRLADGRLRRRMRSIMSGHDVVVDLAGNPSPHIGWLAALANNLASAVSTLDAAATSGISRVVMASSVQVTAGYEQDEPWSRVLAGERRGLDRASLPLISPRDPIRPTSPYAVAKAAAEAAGRHYAETRGLSVLCVRLGTVTGSGRPETVRHRATLLAPEDLVQLIDRCITAPADIGYRILYGVSNNTWRIWDLEDARSIGYEPLIDAEPDESRITRPGGQTGESDPTTEK